MSLWRKNYGEGLESDFLKRWEEEKGLLTASGLMVSWVKRIFIRLQNGRYERQVLFPRQLPISLILGSNISSSPVTMAPPRKHLQTTQETHVCVLPAYHWPGSRLRKRKSWASSLLSHLCQCLALESHSLSSCGVNWMKHLVQNEWMFSVASPNHIYPERARICNHRNVKETMCQFWRQLYEGSPKNLFFVGSKHWREHNLCKGLRILEPKDFLSCQAVDSPHWTEKKTDSGGGKWLDQGHTSPQLIVLLGSVEVLAQLLHSRPQALQPEFLHSV